MIKKIFLSLLIGMIVVCACAYHKAKPLRLTKDLSLPFALPTEQRHIVYYASLAPNAHNVQPWHIRYNPDARRFTLAFDRSKALPHIDPAGREASISLGAFLENFRQAAAAFGMLAEIDILPAMARNGDVARMTLSPLHRASSLKQPAVLKLIERRHTDKRPFQDIALAPRDLAALLKQHQPYLNYYPRGSAGFNKLESFAIQAAKAQALDAAKRAEFAHWLRFSNEEARRLKDGLPAEQLGITGIKKLLYYSFFDRQKAQGEAFAAESISKTASSVAQSAGFFIIGGEETFPLMMRSGMNLQAFWLDAVRYGISVQPVSQMLEDKAFRRQLAETLGLSQPPQMILRAGYVDDYGENNRIRRPIGEFTRLEPPGAN